MMSELKEIVCHAYLHFVLFVGWVLLLLCMQLLIVVLQFSDVLDFEWYVFEVLVSIMIRHDSLQFCLLCL